MVEARTRAALAAVPFEKWTLELEGISSTPEGIGLTVRLCVFEVAATGAREIRDIKEQEIRWPIASAAGAQRLCAFIEGLARALPSIAALNDTASVDSLMPHDLFFPDVLGAVKAQTADEFAALLSDPQERAKLLPDPD